MKNLTRSILFAGMMIIFQSAAAQCPEGNVLFNSQASFDQFWSEYPNCTELLGDLTFSGTNNDITDAAQLANITSIAGDLRFNLNFPDVIGEFTGLISIDGEIRVSNNSDFDIHFPANIQSVSAVLLEGVSNATFSGLDGVTSIEMLRFDNGSENITFNGLQNITSTDNIYFQNVANIQFESGLQNLAIINEKLSITGSQGIFDFSGLSNLQTISEEFVVFSCLDGVAILNLVCQEYCEKVRVENSHFLEFPDVAFGEEDMKTSSLGSVVGAIEYDNCTGLQYLGGIADVTHVTGNVSLKNLPDLNSLGALFNLQTVDGTLSFIDIQNINMFDPVSGSFALQQIGHNLTFNNVGPAVPDNPGSILPIRFKNLVSIGGSLTVVNSLSILTESFSSMEMLQYVGASISLTNTGAASLWGFFTIDYFGEDFQFYLFDNPHLYDCIIPFICDGGSVSLGNNGWEVGPCCCQNENQIYNNCFFDSQSANGKIYADIDCDGVFNGEDVAIPYHLVLNNESEPFAFSIFNGAYSGAINPQQGSADYSFTAAPLAGFENNSVYQVPYGSPTVNNLDFGMCPVADDVTNLSVSVSPLGQPPRPGFENHYQVCLTNLGINTEAGGTLTFELSDLEGASITNAGGGELTGNTVSWSVDNLSPFEFECFSVSIQISSTTNLGTLFHVAATVELDEGLVDADPSNNSFTLEQEVVGSYDPNDKLVDHELIDISNHPGDSVYTLEYLIRFQNTGNFPATFVRVVDVLPDDLDGATIEMIHASHEYELTFDTPSKLVWFFDDINLADSTSNEPESHGYIHFRIKTKQGIEPGDVIENFVSIYFDYNAPIITDYAVTEFVECDSTALSIAAPMEICAGETITLTATPAGFDEYNWLVDGNSYNGQQIQVPLYTFESIELEVSNAVCTMSTSTEISINPQPDMTLLLGPYITCDSVMEVEVFATGEVSWYLADSLVAVGDPVMLDKSGFYLLVCENSCGVQEATIEVVVHSLSIDASAEACTGDNFTIHAMAEGFVGFEWTIEGEDYSGQEVEVVLAGDGLVELIGTSPFCEALITSVQIEVLPQPYMNTILEPWLGCYGEVEIDLDPIGEVNWYLDDELVASGNPVTISESGLYLVIVENECSILENNVAVEVYDIPEEVVLTFDGEQLVVSPEGSGYVWMLGGFPVSTEGPAYTPTESGDYSVIVYFENSMCSQTSNLVFVPVSVNELLEAQIKLYPNPVKDILTIELPRGQWQLNLMNAVGKNLRSVENVTESRFDMELSGIAPGAYFVQVISDEGFVVKKLVVE